MSRKNAIVASHTILRGASQHDKVKVTTDGQVSGLPMGWKKLLLEEAGHYFNGLSGKSKEDFGTGKPYITYLNIYQNSKIKPDMVGFVQIQEGERQNQVKIGDIFFTTSSETSDEIGVASVLLDEIKECYLNSFCLGWRCKLNDILPEYLQYYFRSSLFCKQTLRLAQGFTRYNISKKQFMKTSLVIPPFFEQKTIAAILGKWDKAIELTDKLIAAKEKRFKWLRAKLIKYDNQHNIKLDMISTMASGGTPNTSVSEYYGGSIPWVSIADMTKQGMWIDDTERHLTNLGLQNSAARIYPPNTILYAMYASLGECSIAKKEMASSQAILGIQTHPDKLYYKYLYFYLFSIKNKIKTKGQHGVQPNLNTKIVKNFDIPLPSMAEQKHISHILSTAQKEINLLKQLAEKRRLQKRGLMQKLLTGEWRVNR